MKLALHAIAFIAFFLSISHAQENTEADFKNFEGTWNIISAAGAHPDYCASQISIQSSEKQMQLTYYYKDISATDTIDRSSPVDVFSEKTIIRTILTYEAKNVIETTQYESKIKKVQQVSNLTFHSTHVRRMEVYNSSPNSMKDEKTSDTRLVHTYFKPAFIGNKKQVESTCLYRI